MTRFLITILAYAHFSGCAQDNCYQNVQPLIELTGRLNWGINDGETQQEANNIALSRHTSADSVLNVVYQELHAILDCRLSESAGSKPYQIEAQERIGLIKENLVSGQRAWITMRDAEAANYQLTALGGSIGPLWAASRSKELTIDRIKELLEFMTHLQWTF